MGVTDGSVGMGGRGEGGFADDGIMEGGGCACSSTVGSSSGVAGWGLVAVGVALRAVRRRRR
jgi:MYXO-CTERM domain-containing protein